MTLGERVSKANWLLIGLAVLLTLAGITTVKTAAEGFHTDFAWLQVRWAVIGLAAMLLVLALPYQRIVQARHLLYPAGLLGLVLVLVKGTGRGAGRWIPLGGFRVQPSEFVKLILVVTLAGWLRYETAHRRFKGLALPFALTLVPVALVMKQPDLGTALLLVPILFVMLFAAGARPKHLAWVAGAGVLAGLVLYFTPGLLAPYQKDRISAFVGQGADLSGEDTALLARSQGHQLNRSKMLVGVGGFAGADDASMQALDALPERQTDFIFPVFAASWGLLGTSGLFLVYFLFLAVLLSTALKVREPSGRLLVVGVFTLFAVQVLVNLGMTVGLLPVVGVTLPFFSYGGSSLLTSFLAVGLVLNVGVDPPIEFGRDMFD